MKHIEFGQGFYFLIDLQKKDNVDFSYNMGDFQINIKEHEQRKEPLVLQSDKVTELFQGLKQQIIEQTPIQVESNKFNSSVDEEIDEDITEEII